MHIEAVVTCTTMHEVSAGPIQQVLYGMAGTSLCHNGVLWMYMCIQQGSVQAVTAAFSAISGVAQLVLARHLLSPAFRVMHCKVGRPLPDC